MPKSNARLIVRFSAVTSGYADRSMQLRIEDATSGLMVAEVPLNAGNLLEMISNLAAGGVDGIEGWLNPQALLGDIGKVAVSETRYVPRSKHGVSFQDWEEVVKSWASTVATELDARLRFYSNNRQTFVLHFTRYVFADQTEEAQTALTADVDRKFTNGLDWS